MSQTAPQPNDTELEILKCFWREGCLSAREVHDRVSTDLGWGLSTTRTMLERMRAKGLVSRRDVHGIVVYENAQPKMQVVTRLTRRFAALLDMQHALPAAAFSGSQLLDDADLLELEAMLAVADAAEGGDLDGR